jgi:hypothetical protein
MAGYGHEVNHVIELIRRYLAVTRKGTHEPEDLAELELIYMQVIRQDPEHRLARIHELVLDGVSFNVAEQVRDLLAEEISALDPIAHDETQ